MKIGILGSGVVGQSLGRGFAARGDEVIIGTREGGGGKLSEWAAGTEGRGRAGTFAEAAAFGEIVVLATKWEGTENALGLAGAENLARKIVIDVTNPLGLGAAGPVLAVGFSDSGGEQVQRWLPDSRVVKAFNIITAAEMVNPDFPCGPPTMFTAGDDDGAKQAVAGICQEFGWEVVDIGRIDGARLLEPLAMLWITHGIRTGAWSHAFKLLRK